LEDLTALFRAAVREFGSWHAAVECAGIDYRRVEHRRRWTRGAVVDEIWTHALAGDDLSWTAMRTADPPLVSAARKPELFGSWQRALEAAGVASRSARRHRSWDDETILAAIRRLCDLGSCPRAADMASIDAALLAAARRAYGSWSAAVRRCGREEGDEGAR